MTVRIVLATAIALTVAAPAEASCAFLTEKEQRKYAEAVFTGRVISVRASDGSATFRILEVRKGQLKRGAITRVYPRPHPSSVTMGWNPRRGESWRLYVRRPGERWYTNDCAGTQRA